jgi:peptide/nickel transport system permease protein
VSPGLVLALTVFVVILLAVFFPGLVAPHPPDAVNPIESFRPPGGGHLLGTDQLGRDVFSRVVHGARPSLMVGVGATVFATVVGTLLGLLATSAGRVVDEAVMRITDILLAFPGLLLALLVVTMAGRGTLTATVAIGMAFTPGFIRLARGQAMAVREADYVRAAMILGRGPVSILVRHVLPNAIPPLLVLATVNVGTGIITGSALSFLGLGPPPPAPEWGTMLAESRDFLDVAWVTAAGPGLAITVTVLTVNVLGTRLRRHLDGRGEGVRSTGARYPDDRTRGPAFTAASHSEKSEAA